MKELWLFTVNYPTGAMENSVGHELPAFCRSFERVRVIPMFPGEGERPLPIGAELVRTIHDPYRAASPMQVIRHLGSWQEVMRTIRGSAPSAEIFSAELRVIRAKLRQALHRCLVVRQIMGDPDPERVLMHANWTSDWATVLGLWKLMVPTIRFSTRMRGFDMYAHRAPHDWQVFQAFHMAQAHHVFTASHAGRHHIVERYPQHAAKVSVAHTATFDHGAAPWSPSDTLRIVSCSNIIPLKRVHRIAEALALSSTPVHWTHFGDGPERPRLEGLVAALPPHVRVDLRGAVDNAAILEYYAQHPVDVFVHVSETEGGVAVALQEAASFGIPLLGADAGGVAELVGPETGILLPPDPSPAMIMEQLLVLAARGCDPAYRAGVRAHWAAHFEATLVHDRFARCLQEL